MRDIYNRNGADGSGSDSESDSKSDSNRNVLNASGSGKVCSNADAKTKTNAKVRERGGEKEKESEVILDTNELRLIEGHGRLKVRLSGNRIEAEFHNLEGPRFLTAYLRGKPAEMAPLVASRICGLCYTAHSINAAEAVEEALGITPGEEVVELRRLLYLANNLRSHMMHLLFLAVPPIKNLISVLRLREKDLVEAGTRLLSTSTQLIEHWGGRSVHVPNVVVGGFGALVRGKELMESIQKIESLRADARKFVEHVLEMELPELERFRTMISLKADGYPTYARSAPLIINDGSTITDEEYVNDLEEVVREYSTSKHVYFRGSEATVGALSRIMLNRRRLNSEAREYAERIEWRINPFLMVKAQAVEVMHYLEEIVEAGERLSDATISPNGYPCMGNGKKGRQAEPSCFTGRSGKGIAIAEAPRGTLCHACEIEGGLIKDYRVYTPTAVNSKSIEMDSVEMVKRFRPLGGEKLKYVLEDLVRCYDPCLSCAVSLDFLSDRGS
ncbi:MAG: nickel-dependent hydrogenase large subunit [Candidatus Methanosuratincola sp.]|nr:nickel-dependent hydrogenase large subunit [Candidatus Methanosuratincola sp.]